MRKALSRVYVYIRIRMYIYSATRVNAFVYKLRARIRGERGREILIAITRTLAMIFPHCWTLRLCAAPRQLFIPPRDESSRAPARKMHREQLIVSGGLAIYVCIDFAGGLGENDDFRLFRQFAIIKGDEFSDIGKIMYFARAGACGASVSTHAWPICRNFEISFGDILWSCWLTVKNDAGDAVLSEYFFSFFHHLRDES